MLHLKVTQIQNILECTSFTLFTLAALIFALTGFLHQPLIIFDFPSPLCGAFWICAAGFVSTLAIDNFIESNRKQTEKKP